jgi:class 3 adenylate cyclase
MVQRLPNRLAGARVPDPRRPVIGRGDHALALGVERRGIDHAIMVQRLANRIVKNTGDGFLAEFQSVVDAVRCAVEIQRGMAERNASTPPEKRVEFRVGINLGDVIAEADDIYGDGVTTRLFTPGLATGFA